jgi:hypothetical protein
MTKKPAFTSDELMYIEKIMDINASMGEDRIRKAVEQFILAKAMKEDNFCKLLSKGILEYGEAGLVTKSIRTKIENWRRKLK